MDEMDVTYGRMMALSATLTAVLDVLSEDQQEAFLARMDVFQSPSHQEEIAQALPDDFDETSVMSGYSNFLEFFRVMFDESNE